MSQPKAIDSASSFFLCKRVVNKENKIQTSFYCIIHSIMAFQYTLTHSFQIKYKHTNTQINLLKVKDDSLILIRFLCTFFLFFFLSLFVFGYSKQTIIATIENKEGKRDISGVLLLIQKVLLHFQKIRSKIYKQHIYMYMYI